MTETRDQRIERWMSAMNAVIPSRAEPHLSRETRRALAEAIDASNAAAGGSVMTDRIEALARQIDPEAWRRVKCVVPVKASIGLAASGMSMQEIGAFHLREAQLRDPACRESLRAARIAIGVSLVLGDRLTQHDDGK